MRRWAPTTCRGRWPLPAGQSRAGDVEPFRYELPVASARKSSLLLAALTAGVELEITEPTPTRDHTERMLRSMGATVTLRGNTVRLEPGAPLRPLKLEVAGDFSSAAFLLGLAAIVPGVAIRLPDVGVNPGRTGLVDLLREMGVQIALSREREVAGEPVAELSVDYGGPLRAVDVTPEIVPSLIDELPLLAMLASPRPHHL